MDVCTLKNGTEEAAVFVAATMLVINRMLDERPLHLYALHALAKDQNHRPFGATGRDLACGGLLSERGDGTYHMHSSLRNVVLSAVTVDGVNIRVSNPSKAQ